jgi:hypothetical protein
VNVEVLSSGPIDEDIHCIWLVLVGVSHTGSRQVVSKMAPSTVVLCLWSYTLINRLIMVMEWIRRESYFSTDFVVPLL